MNKKPGKKGTSRLSIRVAKPTKGEDLEFSAAGDARMWK
jgi:hypothetical protein